MADKKLTGRIAADRIRMQSTPKPPAGAVERFLKLGDCTGVISDVMDELGIPAGVIGASVLKPTMPGRVICGPALTVRNIHQRADALAGARASVNKMAEFEAHNLAEDGDVLVIQGRRRHVEHGRHLGDDRQAPGRARRHRHGRRARHPALARGRLSGVGERDHAGHRQVAAGNGRDQRHGDDRRRARHGRRPGRRRRHRRLLHPARPASVACWSVRERQEKAEDTRIDAISRGVPVPVFYGKGRRLRPSFRRVML